MSLPLPDLEPRRTWDEHPALVIGALIFGIVSILACGAALVWASFSGALTGLAAPVSAPIAACVPDSYVPCLGPGTTPTATPPASTPDFLVETGSAGIGLPWQVWLVIGIILAVLGLVGLLIAFIHRRWPEPHLCLDCRVENHRDCDRLACDCPHPMHSKPAVQR